MRRGRGWYPMAREDICHTVEHWNQYHGDGKRRKSRVVKGTTSYDQKNITYSEAKIPGQASDSASPVTTDVITTAVIPDDDE